MGHHPAVSSGLHAGSLLLVRRLQPLLEAYQAVYLSGHDHDLEHLELRGVHHFVSGAGSELRPMGPLRPGAHRPAPRVCRMRTTLMRRACARACMLHVHLTHAARARVRRVAVRGFKEWGAAPARDCARVRLLVLWDTGRADLRISAREPGISWRCGARSIEF